MIRHVNKRTILVINRMCWREAGGLRPVGKNNLRQGCDLGFVDAISTNSLFGQKLYPSVYHKSGAYLYYITNRHIFHDGNKRTGLAVALTFLTWNGFNVRRLPPEDTYQFVIDIALNQAPTGRVIDEAADWLETLI